MSWIFGFYSKKPIDTKFVSELHPPAIESVINNRYNIAIGGNKTTLVSEKNNPQMKYFVCGIPISQDSSKILDKGDLNNIFESPLHNFDIISGHYCGVLIQNDSICFFTDKLGLREIHIYENENGWYFSTRLDWLLKLNHFEIDFNEFGSRWKLINQLSNKSIVKKIHRINCGSKAKIEQNRIEFTECNWLPQKDRAVSRSEFDNTLRKNVLIGTYHNSKISLSLSGGMDSRVVLSYLLSSDYNNWDCHTFKSESNMDSTIAENISKHFHIKYQILSDNNFNHDNMLPDLCEYVGATYLTESGYISRKLMHYESLPQDNLIIDGGFGEIWRREFLTRLYHFGKKDLLDRNTQNISRYLTNHRADIFNEDCDSIMQNGINEQIDKIFSDLPPVKEIGLGNWLDLFSLKTRLVNYYAPEQARIDNYVKAYMPFVQLSLLENLLNVPIDIRKNNRLFKSIIKSNYYKLSKYPLAKGNLSYPYWFTPLMKRAYSKVYNASNQSGENHNKDIYLNKLKEFTLDTISSNAVKEYPPYNYAIIKKNISDYYKGNVELRKFVDWFITFEIFKQKL
ncbi:MAG: hypothetical protein Q8N03_04805 [Ignavibacteria bacterium]|nr:hypothetical protein [Ignavibacteria bacterium]